MSRECKYTVSGYCGLAIPCQGRCMLAPPPKESNSEALRLLLECERAMTLGTAHETLPPSEGSLLWCIRALLARADKDNAAPQALPVSRDATPLGGVATKGITEAARPETPAPAAPAAPPGVADVERILGGTTPAYTISDSTAAPAEQRPATLAEALSVTLARLHDQMSPAERRELREAIDFICKCYGDSKDAPAEAPTPETDAARVEFAARKARQVPNTHVRPDGWQLARKLERQRDAALERERLANMRANQAEEARGAMQAQLADMVQRPDYDAAQSATQRSAEAIQEFLACPCISHSLAELQVKYADLASTSERESE